MTGVSADRPEPGQARQSAKGLCAAGALALLLVLAVGCRPAEEAPAVAESVPKQEIQPHITPQDLATAFSGVSGGEASGGELVAPDISKVSQDDPNWPVLIYLTGEARLQRGDIDGARVAFRDLASRTAADLTGPGSDGWGGSGLAAVALWRWLGIIDEHGGDPTEFDRVLGVAAVLRTTRMFGGMVGSGLLPALPLLEEDVARRLTHVARKAGRPEAQSLLLYFVSINSTGELEPADEAIIEEMIAQGNVTKERLDFFRYQRLINRITVQAQKTDAAEQLGRLSRNSAAPRDVRAEASYEWGNFHRLSKEKKPAVVAALTAAYELSGGKGPVADKALYRRGMVQGSVDPKRMDLFRSDMERLLADYPHSRLADDALYQIATEELFGKAPQADQAFDTFAKLRKFDGPNDWLDSAYLLPAIGYIGRGTETDLQAADQLLEEYVKRFPDGAYRQRCLFWRGRIAEQRQDTTAAQELFRKVVEEAPFNYYGLRARLHLEYGATADQMPLPPTDSRTFAELKDSYRHSRVEAELTGQTPYHDRLRAAEAGGYYVRALAIVDGVGPKFRNRVDNIQLQQLDEDHSIPAVAVVLSLRQDAIAARDSEPTDDNQLRLAGFAGRRLGDWPLAMLTITNETTSTRTSLMAQLQSDPRFLATSYPGMSDIPVLREPLAAAAWPIDGSDALTESLMYSVIRRESAYFPGAISPVGAIGLFQIMPATFQNRKNCWRWPADAPTPTAAAYLFDPERNVQFWSCWIQKEFNPKTRGDIAPLIMAHNAGVGNLKEWRRAWRGRAVAEDLELQIESVRFRATQNFVRRVLTDTAIAESSGLFGGGTVGHEQTP